MDSRRTIATPRARAHTFGQGTARARGEIGYPPAGSRFLNMNGQPVREKLMRYAPIEDAGRREDCAMLFIIAGAEELHDNKDHAILAHERAQGVKKLVTMSGPEPRRSRDLGILGVRLAGRGPIAGASGGPSSPVLFFPTGSIADSPS
jgi:hypothetical protein